MKDSNFFAQLIVRLASGNPKFFKYIQVVSLVLVAVSAALNTLPTDATPSWIAWAKSSVVWVSGLVAAVVAQLPNKDAVSK